MRRCLGRPRRGWVFWGAGTPGWQMGRGHADRCGGGSRPGRSAGPPGGGPRGSFGRGVFPGLRAGSGRRLRRGCGGHARHEAPAEYREQRVGLQALRGRAEEDLGGLPGLGRGERAHGSAHGPGRLCGARTAGGERMGTPAAGPAGAESRSATGLGVRVRKMTSRSRMTALSTPRPARATRSSARSTRRCAGRGGAPYAPVRSSRNLLSSSSVAAVARRR